MSNENNSAFVPLERIHYSKDGFTDPLNQKYELAVNFKDNNEGANFFIKSRNDKKIIVDGFLHLNKEHSFALRSFQSASPQGIMDGKFLGNIPKILHIMNGGSVTYFRQTLNNLAKAKDEIKHWTNTKKHALSTIESLNDGKHVKHTVSEESDSSVDTEDNEDNLVHN